MFLGKAFHENIRVTL